MGEGDGEGSERSGKEEELRSEMHGKSLIYARNCFGVKTFERLYITLNIS